jgi:hypothetical protein
LVIGVEVGITYGAAYYTQTGTDIGIQLSILLALAIALAVGFYVRDIGSSVKALFPAQVLAFVGFYLILPYTHTELGASISDSMSDRFGVALIFLVGLAIFSFIVGLVGSVIGSFLGEWNETRKTRRNIPEFR